MSPCSQWMYQPQVSTELKNDLHRQIKSPHFTCPAAPDDYTATTVELSFDADTNRSCVNIPIDDDNFFEDMENFTVSLNSSDPDVTLVPDTAVVTITDDDSE